MENLIRYNLQLNGRTGNVDLIASNDGFLVKFSDLAEALKPSHNSDYAAALRVLKEYYGDVDLKKVSGFAEYCVRLNASTHFA